MSHAADIERYESGANALHEWIDGLSSADLDAHPVPGTWSMRQLVVHMVDSDLVYTHRMRKIAAERKPLMTAYDETLFASTEALQAGDPGDLAAIFAANRRWTAAFLRALPADAWSREGVHAERGIVTIASLVTMITAHGPHHAKFAQAKRAKLGKSALSGAR